MRRVLAYVEVDDEQWDEFVGYGAQEGLVYMPYAEGGVDVKTPRDSLLTVDGMMAPPPAEEPVAGSA